MCEWADVDVQAALAFVANAPRFRWRNSAYAVPLTVLSSQDPKTAIAWIQQNIANPNDRAQIAEEIINRLGDTEPAVGLELAFGLGLAVDDGRYGELMGKLARTEPRLALQQLEKLPPGERKIALNPMLATWAETNPEQALAWYVSQQEKQADAAAYLIEGCMKKGTCQVGNLIQQLSLTTADADRVLAHLNENDVFADVSELGLFSTEARQQSARCYAWKLSEDPEKVISYAKASVPPERLAETLYSGWGNWLDSDRKAAMAWLQQQPDRQLAVQLNQLLQQKEQASDPVRALASLPTITDPKQRNISATQAVDRLADDKPDAAADWLAQNQSEPLESGVYGSVAAGFLKYDEEAAMKWISKLSSGEAKDAALAVAAHYWSEKEIDFATTSMAAISDAQKRQACMFDVYRQLTERDAGTAELWLEKQGLSPEVRQSWKALAGR